MALDPGWYPVMTSGISPSPIIESQRWGVIDVAGEGRFKDAKLWPGGAREWDWGETGTHHSPGIQVADFQELLDRGTEVLVLSRGVWQRLMVSPEAREFLAQHAIEHEILETEAAVKRYNELAASRAVGGLFHSTC